MTSNTPVRGAWLDRVPLARALVWALASVGIALVVQGIAWLVGSKLDVLHSEGALLVVLALPLLPLVSADSRGPAAYGLVIGDDWSRQVRRGLAAGVVAGALFALAAVGLGALQLSAPAIPVPRLFGVPLVALSCIPQAVVLHVIFAGCLLTLLREQVGAIAAALVSGSIMGALFGIANSTQATFWAGIRIAIPMTLLGVLLGLTRLRYGNLVRSAAVLAGWLMFARVMRHLNLLHPVPDAAAAEAFCPLGDSRQGYVVWCLLAGGNVLMLVSLLRNGAAKMELAGPALSVSFKKVVPFSNLLLLAPLDLWIGRLIEARFRIGGKYFPRLLWVLAGSTINTILTFPERLLAPLLLRHRVQDPVFVVGTHRSGTTHLHYLLGLDRQFCAPRNFQAVNPHGCLTSGWLLLPLLALLLSSRRAMDAVKMTAFSPQEDEWALGGMIRETAHWAGTFPREVATYDRFTLPASMTGRELHRWERAFLLFLRKVTLWSSRTPLLKNPYNTARVKLLAKLFPRAKFVHICRHPYDTYRSNMVLAEHGWSMFQLQDPYPDNNYSTRFLANYRSLEDAFYRDVADLPPGSWCEVRFEDLEREPMEQMQRIYEELGLTLDDRNRQRLERYLASLAGYRKNRHAALDENTRQAIHTCMGPYFERWGYDTPATAEHVKKAA